MRREELQIVADELLREVDAALIDTANASIFPEVIVGRSVARVPERGGSAGASRGSRRLRLRAFSSPATITRVERFGETRRLPGITDAVETVEANPSHQVNHAIA